MTKFLAPVLVALPLLGAVGTQAATAGFFGSQALSVDQTKGGAIVNVSTFSAFEPSPAFPVSSALRAALGGFTKLYADEYAARGIRMNNVLPGFVESYPVDADTVRRIPMGRPGTLREIARTVAFLLSEDAGYITGQNIRVDGGLTRSV